GAAVRAAARTPTLLLPLSVTGPDVLRRRLAVVSVPVSVTEPLFRIARAPLPTDNRAVKVTLPSVPLPICSTPVVVIVASSELDSSSVLVAASVTEPRSTNRPPVVARSVTRPPPPALLLPAKGARRSA